MKSPSYPCSAKSTARAALTLLACVVLSVISASAFAEAAAPALDSAMSAIARFEAGQDSAPLVATTDAVIAAFDDAPGRAAIAKRLAALLESSATLQGKEFVCKQLYLIGGDEILPVLAKMLNDEKTADMARYALQRMPGEKARDVLLKALNGTSGKVRVGVINSLGERRETKSVKVLAKLVRARDAAEASAAICALGKIGDSQAAKALSAAKHKVAPALRAELSDARLKCANALLSAGKSSKAAALCKPIYEPKDTSPASIAAFLGLVAAQGESAAPLVLNAFKSDDVKWQYAATEAARSFKGDKVSQAALAQIASLSPIAQSLLIGVAADRGDAVALPAFVNLTASPDPAVRLAALNALGRLGNAANVPLLAKASVSAEKTEAEAAQTSLATLRGKDIDSAIAQALPQAEPPVKAQLIRTLATRNAVDAVPTLLTAAGDPDEAVRTEAFVALAALAKPDQLPALIDGLVNAQGEKTRGEAETAVVTVAQKIKTENTRASAVLAKLLTVKNNATAQSSLVRVLGRIGDDGALPAIRTAANDSNPEVKEAAIRALAGWSNDAVLPDLERLAQKGGETQRLTALRGFLRVLTLPSKRSEEQTLQLYEIALKLAPSPAEKKTALAGLANVHTERVKNVVKPFLNDPQYAAEAQAALGKLAKTTLIASASDNDAEAKLAIDGNVDTRWSSGAPQKPGQWFQLDLGWERSVSKITLDSTPSAGDYPRGYEVFVSKSPSDWGRPVAKGNGNGPITEIKFASKDGRYIRIVQAGTEAGLWWSIHEIRVDSQ